MNKYFLYVIVSLLLSISGLKAQRTYFLSEEWSVGLNAGATTFYGDLTDKANRFFSSTPFSKYFYQDRQWMASLTLEKKINIYFGVRGNLNYGNIKSTQESVKAYFKAHLFEYSLSGTIDFTNIFMGYDRFRTWGIYGTAGIGFTESRTWKYSMTSGELIGTNGFGIPKREGGRYVPMTETVIPIGLGFNYKPFDDFSFQVELSYRPIHTDKLDATLSDKSSLEAYGMINVGATYHFALPNHWRLGSRNPRYNGRSTDPAIKAFNKRKHVIMKTKGYKRGLKLKRKKRHKLKRRRR